jgi:hypothetical protein
MHPSTNDSNLPAIMRVSAAGISKNLQNRDIASLVLLGKKHS